GDLAGRVELDDHVRGLVRRPDDVVLLDPHRVRERPSVEIAADLANVRAIGAEFQKLRRARCIGRACGVAAGKHKNMALGIDRYARGLSEIQVWGKLQQIWNGLKRN